MKIKAHWSRTDGSGLCGEFTFDLDYPEPDFVTRTVILRRILNQDIWQGTEEIEGIEIEWRAERITEP